jgi:RNA polymerase sigma-70 factor (ECF subfamily)
VFAIPFIEPAVLDPEARRLDPDGFRAFYDEVLPGVYGYLLHRSGGMAAVAEDLTQETFLAAVAELRKGRRPDAPGRWIYGIARHKLLDHYRRQERLEGVVAIGAGAELEEVELDVGGEDVRERAIAALAAVPASQRGALVLRYLDGFGVGEIAAMLGTSEKAVESLLGRGRAGFKRAYLEAAP